MVAAGVKAEDDFGARRMFKTDSLRADGYSAIRTELESGPLAPNIRPARTMGRWADDGTFLIFGQVPGALCGSAKFAMGFMAVAVVT